jgi:hypothetical protein
VITVPTVVAPKCGNPLPLLARGRTLHVGSRSNARRMPAWHPHRIGGIINGFGSLRPPAFPWASGGNSSLNRAPVGARVGKGLQT